MTDIDIQQQEEQEAIWRQTARQAAIDQEEERKKKEKEEDQGGAIQKGASRLLRWAWLNLLPSLGLSVIYINMHVFLRLVFPKAFCKLGEEWMPKRLVPHSAKNIAGTAFGIVEILGLVLLDVIAFFIIMSIIVFIWWLLDNVIIKTLASGEKVYEWIFE